MWTNWQFWKDSTWRALRTFCQTLAGLLGGQALAELSMTWWSMLQVSATAALISLLMSVDRERAVGWNPKTGAVVEDDDPPTEALPVPPQWLTGCGGDLR